MVGGTLLMLLTYYDIDFFSLTLSIPLIYPHVDA